MGNRPEGLIRTEEEKQTKCCEMFLNNELLFMWYNLKHIHASAGRDCCEIIRASEDYRVYA
jgi:hypothetical protein